MKTSKAKILPMWEKEFNDKVVPTPVKEALVSEQTGGFKIFGANAKVYDSSDATLVNLENIHLVYTAILRTADKDADTSSLAVQSLEEHIARGDDNAFKTALATEHFAEEFLRACRDLAGDQKNVGSIISPRGKQNSKSKSVLLTKATLYFEDQSNVDKAISYVREVLNGRRPEKVREFQPVESINEKPTFVIDEVPQWKKNLEAKKAQQNKPEEKKDDLPVNAVPSWQQKLAEKKVEKPKEEPKDQVRMNDTPGWMKNLASKEKKEIAPEEKKEDTTGAPKFGLNVLKKSDTPVVEKKEEKKEEPKFGLGILKKTEVVVEKKVEKKEEPSFGLGLLKKTGNPDPAKDNAPKEAKQVDFRGALKKDGKSETEETKEEPKVEVTEKETPKVEEPVKETIVEQPKVEEPIKEEVKVEAQVQEAPKVEQLPVEVQETPKVEAPKEEPKVEAPKEEPVVAVEQVTKPEEPVVQETKTDEPVTSEPVVQDGVIEVALEGKELEKEKLNSEKNEQEISQESQ